MTLPISEHTESTPITNRSLRICLLGYRNNPFSGGQGVYIHYLSKALVNAGHSVDVIAAEPYPLLDPRVKLIPLPGLNLFDKKNHVTALRLQHLFSWTDFFEWLSMLTGGFPEPYTFGRRLVHYFKKNRCTYDIIHDNQSLCYGLVKLQKSGHPVVATIHHPITRDRDIAVQSASDWKIKLLIKRWHHFLHMQIKVSNELNYLVTVSDTARRDIAQDFNLDEKRITRIYNGIDSQVFKPKENIEKLPFTLLTTASADSPLKGLEYLIRAFAIVVRRFPEAKLQVVGAPSKDSLTQQLIDENDLQKSVSFIRGISTEELVEMYNLATLVVTPSIYEGFGFPAGEAMACGAAVIATDGGALPEVVGDAGVIVKKGNADALASAIQNLFEDEQKLELYRRLGRQRIQNLFSWQRAAEEMTLLYQLMLDERAR